MPSVSTAIVLERPDAADRLGVVRGDRQRLVDRCVEGRQAARIDRVEADVRAIRLAEQIAEQARVVDHRQLHPVLLALGPIGRPGIAVVDPARQPAA